MKCQRENSLKIYIQFFENFQATLIFDCASLKNNIKLIITHFNNNITISFARVKFL